MVGRPVSGGEYVPDAAADDALCTAADDRAAQYAVPDATDDDLALADSVFVNRVHQAILGSTWMEERLEQARADERARLGAATTHTERDMGLSDGHSESYRAGWRMGAAAAREDEREHIAQRLDAQWRHRSDYDRMTVGRARRTAVRIARERNNRG